jgi:hypothetical protein
MAVVRHLETRARTNGIMEGLRNFHNHVKEDLLGEALKACRSGTDLNVLDLACGCLGDIHKYVRSNRI